MDLSVKSNVKVYTGRYSCLALEILCIPPLAYHVYLFKYMYNYDIKATFSLVC